MKVLLLGLLFAVNVFSSPFVEDPIDANLIRTTFQRLWDKSGSVNDKDLENSLRSHYKSYYKNVATCVWESHYTDHSEEIFFSAISLGIKKQNVGPFEREFLSFNYLKHGHPSTIRFENEERLRSELFRLVRVEDLLDTIETYNQHVNDGAYLKDTSDRDDKPILRMVVKPITDSEGLKDVSYLININYVYLCIL